MEPKAVPFPNYWCSFYHSRPSYEQVSKRHICTTKHRTQSTNQAKRKPKQYSTDRNNTPPAETSSRSPTYRQKRPSPYVHANAPTSTQRLELIDAFQAIAAHRHRESKHAFKGTDASPRFIILFWKTENTGVLQTPHFLPFIFLTTQKNKGKFDLRTLIQAYSQA